MNTKIALLGLVALAFASGCAGPDPEAEKAKAAILALDSDISALRAKAEALPRLEFSTDARRDLEAEQAFLDVFSYIYRLPPGEKEFSDPRLQEEASRAYTRLMGTISSRNAPGVTLQAEKGPEGFLDAFKGLDPIAGEDLQKLETLADAYNSTLRLAREGVKKIPPAPFNRTPATEPLAQDYERKKTQYEGLAASLEVKSSSDFRSGVQRARDAHRVFEIVSGYLPEAGPKPPPPDLQNEVSRVFPAAADAAKRLADCWVAQEPECGQATFNSKRMAPLLEALAGEFRPLLNEVAA